MKNLKQDIKEVGRVVLIFLIIMGVFGLAKWIFKIILNS